MTKLYAIIDSKFHGGGILYQSKSPRQILKAKSKYMDGCFDGIGCQGFGVSFDGGETWYQVHLEKREKGHPVSDYYYSDMSISSDEWLAEEFGPISPASQTTSALSLAL